MRTEQTNDELILGFVAAMRRRNLAATTIYRRRTLLLAIGRQHALPALIADDLEEWIQARKMVARSRNAYIADFLAFYEWAVRTSALDHNPVVELERSKVPRLLPRPISDRDLAVVIETATPRMRTWLVLAAYAGLRCCEIASLAAEDLVWHKDPPVIFVKRGKGGHQRQVPMSEYVEQAIRNDQLPRTGYLFRSRVGHEHVSANSVSTLIGRHFRDVGVQATAHQLRHHFGTRVYEDSMDIRVTQEMLGHMSPTTTAIYTAWSMPTAAGVVRKLGPRAS